MKQLTNPIDECLAHGEYHCERIVCPECRWIQVAEVIHTKPFAIYVHCCRNCNYIIMESEWECIDKMEKTKPSIWLGFIDQMWLRIVSAAVGITFMVLFTISFDRIQNPVAGMIACAVWTACDIFIIVDWFRDKIKNSHSHG